MNYLVDRLNFLESENKKTQTKMFPFVSKKEKPKVKDISNSIKLANIIVEKKQETDNSNKIKSIKDTENKKSKPVVWL